MLTALESESEPGLVLFADWLFLHGLFPASTRRESFGHLFGATTHRWLCVSCHMRQFVYGFTLYTGRPCLLAAGNLDE